MQRFGTAPALLEVTHRLQALALLLAVALGATACGRPEDARDPSEAAATETPGRLEPASAIERQVLGALDEWQPSTARKVGADTVVAEAPYLAASGQECRSVQFAQGARLACRDEQGWYFVPDVFGSDSPAVEAAQEAPSP